MKELFDKAKKIYTEWQDRKTSYFTVIRTQLEALEQLEKTETEILNTLIEISEYLTRNKLNSVCSGSRLHWDIDNIIEKVTGKNIKEVLDESHFED